MNAPKTYRKKPVEIQAVQWFDHGDHAAVHAYSKTHPARGKSLSCCSKTTEQHGWINTLEGGHIVCPGDWIIRGIKGELYPCKPGIFALTYDAVEEPK